MDIKQVTAKDKESESGLWTERDFIFHFDFMTKTNHVSWRIQVLNQDSVNDQRKIMEAHSHLMLKAIFEPKWG